MRSQYPDDDFFEEFEKEFSPEQDHPLQTLGTWIIVSGCLIIILIWLMSLFDMLRH